MKVDNLAEERVDFQVGTGDSFEVTERNNWQATRNYQSCNTATSGYIINKTKNSSADEIANVNFLRRHCTLTTKYKKKTKTNS